jgi:hypothetical protein
MKITKILLAAKVALWAAATVAPAFAAGGSTLLKLSITSANSLQAGAGNCTGTTASCSLSQVQVREGSPESATIQCNFTYGSGGTSTDVWIQTSVDGGTTASFLQWNCSTFEHLG